MAKLSASALRTAAANAREKNAENAVLPLKNQVKENEESKKAAKGDSAKTASKKRGEKDKVEVKSASSFGIRGMLHSEDGERKTEHVNLLITPTLSKKIEVIQTQGGFRSKNAAVIAVLEAFCDANEIR